MTIAPNVCILFMSVSMFFCLCNILVDVKCPVKRVYYGFIAKLSVLLFLD